MPDQGARAILRGHCPGCDAERNAEVLAQDTVEGEHKASGIWYRSTYSILRCLGCDRRYFHSSNYALRIQRWKTTQRPVSPFWR